VRTMLRKIMLIARNAQRRLREPARLVAELLFFSLAGWAALASGQTLLAALIVPLAFVSCSLLRVVGTAAP
jgi:4-hydroxybenzoate polyprenyltransferase